MRSQLRQSTADFKPEATPQPAPVSDVATLVNEKLANFKKYVADEMKNEGGAKLLAEVDKWHDGTLGAHAELRALLLRAAPLVLSGGFPEVFDKIVEHLSISPEHISAPVRLKLTRYIEFFFKALL